ncbi:MAG: hypothetical protein ACE37B_22300 [Ilumatobacter sp.]|uniref:DUF7064 domain-containing protein n=1 Tax=Ilumatobacter sp. TaxID=1967498 RepID=UPI003919AE83
MAVRLDESDEYMHELGPESNFNESMYINCFDHGQGVGGWFRIGNRANEGYAEMTVCLYLPAVDGHGGRQVAFQYKRPEIDNNDAFDAGGLTWTMVTPFEELQIDYTGKVLLLDEPEQMANPRDAFKNNEFVEAEVHLTFGGQGRASMFGGEPDEPHEAPGEEFAKGHYEQLISGTGTIRVGEREWQIDGFGLRDHSWGPRYWQAPWYYRWLTGNVDADFGFMASRVAKKDGPGTRGGFVWENGKMHYCDDVQMSTVTRGDEHYHDTIEFTISSSRSERSWTISGEAIDLIPLRNRRQTPDGDWLQTRISEAFTKWTVRSGEFEGRTGFGMSEYLDQIIDDAPVGIAE